MNSSRAVAQVLFFCFLLPGAMLFHCVGSPAPAGPGPNPAGDTTTITGGGGCLHKSRTACIEYSSSFKPGEVRRQCLNRDVETFLPAGCPVENRLGRCTVRADMTIFFYNKLSAAGAARVCRNSFNGRWAPDA